MEWVFCAGFESNGFRTIWANDFDRNVKNTYQYNFPHAEFISGPIEDIKSERHLCPCSTWRLPVRVFLQRGARSGFNDPKGRGKLFDVMMDKIEEIKELPLVLVLKMSPI